MANNTLIGLEARLDAAVAAAADAQEARDAARARAGLPKAPKAFFTAAEMIAEMCAAQDRHDAESRFETNALISAVITDCRMRWDRSYVPTPLEAAIAKWPAAFAALDGAKKTDNVIPLRTAEAAQQIVEAARKARGET
jgi:hypothetical protein